MTLLERGTVDSVTVSTNDVAAFRGIERTTVEHGYSDAVTMVESFAFVDRVVDLLDLEHARSSQGGSVDGLGQHALENEPAADRSPPSAAFLRHP